MYWCRFRHSGSSLSLSKVQAVLFRRTENDSISLKGSQESPRSVFFIYFICLNMWHQLHALARKNTIATLGMFIMFILKLNLYWNWKKCFLRSWYGQFHCDGRTIQSTKSLLQEWIFFSFNKFYLQDIFCIIKVRKCHKNYFLIMIWVLIGA